MSLRDLIDDAIGDVPRIDAAACVHARVEVASCRRCVETCPSDAWRLDDEQLALDTQRCNGCGACIGACPEGALSPPGDGRLAAVEQGVVELTCRRIDGAASVTCKHALGLRELTRLYRAGMRRLRLRTADCSACPSNTGSGLSSRVELLNRVLFRRGLATLDIESLATRESGDRPRVDRRRFLRRLFDTVVDRPSATADPHDPAGLALPAGPGGNVALYSPQLDAERCTGCDACVRVCRHAAIRLVQDPDAYRIDAERCTGCGLCRDVCEHAAIVVSAGEAVEVETIALQTGRCRACGVHYHRPRGADGTGLCQVCTRANHQRRLYQVL